MQEKLDEDIMQVLKELETDPVAGSVTPLKIDRRKVYAASDRARAWVNALRVKP